VAYGRAARREIIRRGIGIDPVSILSIQTRRRFEIDIQADEFVFAVLVIVLAFGGELNATTDAS